MFWVALFLAAALLGFLVYLAIPPRRTRERMWRRLKEAAETTYGFFLLVLAMIEGLVSADDYED